MMSFAVAVIASPQSADLYVTAGLHHLKRHIGYLAAPHLLLGAHVDHVVGARFDRDWSVHRSEPEPAPAIHSSLPGPDLLVAARVLGLRLRRDDGKGGDTGDNQRLHRGHSRLARLEPRWIRISPLNVSRTIRDPPSPMRKSNWRSPALRFAPGSSD